MNSCFVQACPGSGKTTTLVAKLAILADRIPNDGRGICVLSHTNVAREEIEKKLKGNQNLYNSKFDVLGKIKQSTSAIQEFSISETYRLSPLIANLSKGVCKQEQALNSGKPYFYCNGKECQKCGSCNRTYAK